MIPKSALDYLSCGTVEEDVPDLKDSQDLSDKSSLSSSSSGSNLSILRSSIIRGSSSSSSSSSSSNGSWAIRYLSNSSSMVSVNRSSSSISSGSESSISKISSSGSSSSGRRSRGSISSEGSRIGMDTTMSFEFSESQKAYLSSLSSIGDSKNISNVNISTAKTSNTNNKLPSTLISLEIDTEPTVSFDSSKVSESDSSHIVDRIPRETAFKIEIGDNESDSSSLISSCENSVQQSKSDTSNFHPLKAVSSFLNSSRQHKKKMLSMINKKESISQSPMEVSNECKTKTLKKKPTLFQICGLSSEEFSKSSYDQENIYMDWYSSVVDSPICDMKKRQNAVSNHQRKLHDAPRQEKQNGTFCWNKFF